MNTEKEKARLIEIIPEIKKNIISKIVKNFISNFTSKEKDIEKYTYHWIEEIIRSFSFKNQVDQKTKKLNKYFKYKQLNL